MTPAQPAPVVIREWDDRTKFPNAKGIVLVNAVIDAMVEEHTAAIRHLRAENEALTDAKNGFERAYNQEYSRAEASDDTAARLQARIDELEKTKC